MKKQPSMLPVAAYPLRLLIATLPSLGLGAIALPPAAQAQSKLAQTSGAMENKWSAANAASMRVDPTCSFVAPRSGQRMSLQGRQ